MDRDSATATKEIQDALDAAMFAESEPERDFPWKDQEIYKLGLRSSYRSRYNFIR